MKSGHSFQDALKISIGVMHIWAEGKNPWSPHHTGHVTPATQAKAKDALAQWEKMKAEAHARESQRSVEILPSLTSRDGMGSFVGEGGTSGASNFLPAGPSKKQDKEIHDKETASPHRFHGDNLSSCDECGESITAAIHRSGGKKAAQPIAPVPDQIHYLRHRGPNHPPVSTGHIKGVPARQLKAAAAANLKNFGIAEPPLEAALHTHFAEQRQATVNRLLGKRGGRMLKREAERLKLGASYGDAKPAMFPQPNDDQVTTAQPNTTAPLAEPDFATEIADEQAQGEALPSLSPQEVFDSGHWADKLAGVLEAHLTTAATLAQGAVQHQLSTPVDLDDSASHEAVHKVLSGKAAQIADMVTRTTAKHLAGVLQQGVANGEDRDTVAARVNQVFDHAAAARVPLIARNAIVGTYNQAAYHYAANLPNGLVGSRVWMSHHDGDTRDAHKSMDGQERPLRMPYVVKESTLMFPGDTNAPQNTWQNCRCSTCFMPPGMAWKAMAQSAQEYVNALKAKPPTPVSPYVVPAS
jgi:hypothetical protein